MFSSTLCLLASSAVNICKQFGSRSGSKLFDTQMVFLKEFFENVDFKKISRRRKMENYPVGKELIFLDGGI